MDWTNILIAAGTLVTGVVALKVLIFSSIERKLGDIDRKFDRIDHRLDRMEQKIDGLSDRVARLEGAFWRNTGD